MGAVVETLGVATATVVEVGEVLTVRVGSGGTTTGKGDLMNTAAAAAPLVTWEVSGVTYWVVTMVGVT